MRERLTQLVLGAFAVLFPCALLGSDVPPFSLDWYNHVWLVAHTADHVRQAGTPPLSLTTTQLGGAPYPVFYGSLLYPLLGAPGAVVGAPVAVRAALVGLFALQYILVRRAARAGGAGVTLANVAACLTVWAIYPLSNVYQRGALTETFAAGCLTCALCRWFALLDATEPLGRVRAALEVGLFYALAAGSHPITALYGAVFLGLFAATVFVRAPGADRAAAVGRLAALVPAAVLVLAVLAPWAYACAQFGGDLAVQGNPKVYVFPESIDRLWVRLFPVPADVRTLRGVPPGTVMPVDAQINVPLLILAGAVLGALARAPDRSARLLWLAVPVVLCVAMLWLSLSRKPYNHLPTVFRVVQFPCRLVTYVNLSLLAALFLALRLTGRAGAPTGWGTYSPAVRTGLIAAAVTLSAAGVLLKLVSAPERLFPDRPDVRELPDTFYGWFAYSTPKKLPSLSAEDEARLVRVSLAADPQDPHRYAPTPVERAEPGFVAMQVQVFPWNAFYLDGRRVPEADLRTWDGRPEGAGEWARGPYTAVAVPAGRHVLEHRFEPSPVWVRLYVLSFGVLAFWALVTLALHLRRVGRPAADPDSATPAHAVRLAD